MPPWPPEPGYGEFVGERRLTEDVLGLIQQWVDEGSPEGALADLPQQPAWIDGWQLGKPDLLVQLPQPYTLPATGQDVYRNFVIPIPVKDRRYVQAVELRPGNRSAHHAFLLFDRTRQSRRLDEQDAEPGFPGMSQPVTATAPPSQFLSWQPGKTVLRGTADSIWSLQPNTDLVLQMHFQPTGKPELIQPSVGFYFTDTRPNPAMSKIAFKVYRIDIPPGATDYVVSDSYVLPVDVEVTAVLPHAHWLGKQVEGYALRPDGTKQWLLRIPHWDFNWQGDYQLREPVLVSKGSTLTMRWTYDNSTNNIHNPNHPPIRVVYGTNTTNEMAELSFQLRLRNTNELAVLEENLAPKTVRDVIEFNTWRLEQNPNDAVGHARLGRALAVIGGRRDEAVRHLERAVELQPELDEAHYALGLLLEQRQDLAAARREFEKVVNINPDHSKAHTSLGFVFASLGNLKRSEEELRTALRLDPEDAQARSGLAELLQAKDKIEKAKPERKGQ
jgi:Tfp pilus assembly protein PilF